MPWALLKYGLHRKHPIRAALSTTARAQAALRRRRSSVAADTGSRPLIISRGSRHPQCRRYRKGLPRGRQYGTQYGDRPVELSDVGGCRLLRRVGLTVSRSIAELDFNIMYSERGHLTLAHTDAAIRTSRWRAEVNKHLSVDSELDRSRTRSAGFARNSTCLTMRATRYLERCIIRRERSFGTTRWPGAMRPQRHDLGVESITHRGHRHHEARKSGGWTLKRPAERSSRARSCKRSPAPAASRRHGRIPPADPHSPAAGVRVAAAQAFPGPDHRVGKPAHLCFANLRAASWSWVARRTPTRSTPRARRWNSRKG